MRQKRSILRDALLARAKKGPNVKVNVSEIKTAQAFQMFQAGMNLLQSMQPTVIHEAMSRERAASLCSNEVKPPPPKVRPRRGILHESSQISTKSSMENNAEKERRKHSKLSDAVKFSMCRTLEAEANPKLRSRLMSKTIPAQCKRKKIDGVHPKQIRRWFKAHQNSRTGTSISDAFRKPGRVRFYGMQQVEDAVKWAEDMHEAKNSKSIKEMHAKMEADLKKMAGDNNQPEPEPSLMTKWRTKKVSNLTLIFQCCEFARQNFRRSDQS